MGWVGPGGGYRMPGGCLGWLRGCARLGLPAWWQSFHSMGWWSWLWSCARLASPAWLRALHFSGLLGRLRGCACRVSPVWLRALYNPGPAGLAAGVCTSGFPARRCPPPPNPGLVGLAAEVRAPGSLHIGAYSDGSHFMVLGWRGWLRGYARLGCPAWWRSSHGPGRWSWLRGGALLGSPARVWVFRYSRPAGLAAGVCTPRSQARRRSLHSPVGGTPFLGACQAVCGDAHSWEPCSATVTLQARAGRPRLRGAHTRGCAHPGPPAWLWSLRCLRLAGPAAGVCTPWPLSSVAVVP